MKKLQTYFRALLFSLIFSQTSFIGICQVVNIPDANFKSYLLNNLLINSNSDSEIQVGEAAAFSGSIDVAGDSISDLTGIEAFTALTMLTCNNNQLTNLNVSANTALTRLYCSLNPLGSLDVSANTALTNLECAYNSLTSLDVSANTALVDLRFSCNFLTSVDVSANTGLTLLGCGWNSLTSLDVSANTALTYLSCEHNPFTSLDVSANASLNNLICNSSSSLASLNVKNGNNANFNSFWAYSNPNLLCIEVDDTAWASANWTVANNQIDATASFSEDCIDINCSADFTLYPDTVLDHNWFLIAEVNGAQPISYFWEWGDGATSTGSNPSHTYNVPGYYNICLTITDANNCSSTYCDSSTYVYKTDEIITISVVDQIPNGIEETENSFVKVYPNPASSSITIETGQGKGIYQLQDVSGKIILQGSINAARYTLDISILAKGIYVLSITDGDKQAHKKIVKE